MTVVRSALFALALAWAATPAAAGTPAATWPASVQQAYDAGMKARAARDYARARTLLRTAADAGHPKAGYELGTMLSHAEGGPTTGAAREAEKAQGVQWVRRAAEQGLAEAQIDMGVRYYGAIGVPKDLVAARAWLGKAAEQGDVRGQFLLGDMLLGGGHGPDPAEGIRWMRKAAENASGDVKDRAIAQFRLGLAYTNGTGVAKDATEAAKWLRRGADNGQADAQHSLAEAYLAGTGVAKDPAEAVRWLRKAAEGPNGYASGHAQLDLGKALADGHGTAKDPVEAARWLRKAADQGSAEAGYYLALCYSNGFGVDRNPDEAGRWLQRAADGGYPAAQYAVGALMLRDEGDQYRDTAVSWLRKAAAQGNGEAKEALKKLGVSER